MNEPEFIVAAIKHYIMSRVSDKNRKDHNTILRASALINKLEDKIHAIQHEECDHPLIARETKDRGSSGHWDDTEGTYWTDHKCFICNLRWTTDQNWKNTGDGMGYPPNYKPKNKPPKKLSEDTIRAAQLAGMWGDVEFKKHGIKEGSLEATIYALARLDAVKLIRGEEDEPEST